MEQQRLSPGKRIALDLFKTQVLQFGDYTLKSGKKSPYYFDLRKLISFPTEFANFCKYVADFIKTNMPSDGVEYNHIAGVPFGAIPYAVQVGSLLNTSIIMPRKEAKTYGSCNSIEGTFNIGDDVLVIEDTITSGQSCLDTIRLIERAGCVVSAVLILTDRQEGGAETLEEQGYAVYTLFEIEEILDNLLSLRSIDTYQKEAIMYHISISRKQFIRNISKQIEDKTGIEDGEVGGGSGVHSESRTTVVPSSMYDMMKYDLPNTMNDDLREELGKKQMKIRKNNADLEKLTKEGKKNKIKPNTHEYKVYSPIFHHRLQVALLDLIITKKSALCLSLDYSTWEKSKALIEKCGEYIVMVKVHVDLFTDFNDNFGKEMKELARRYKFFVMEDSKLADVDSITFRRMMGGFFKIDEWASFVTIHGLTYDSVIDYYKRQYNSSYPLNLSPCIVAQMNAENNLLNEDYTKRCLEMLENDKIGSPVVICQSLPEFNSRIKATPGVSLEITENVEGRKYRSVEDAIVRDGNHIIIVGSNIIYENDPVEMTKKYANKSWECFSEVYPGIIKEYNEFIEDLQSYATRTAEQEVNLC